MRFFIRNSNWACDCHVLKVRAERLSAVIDCWLIVFYLLPLVCGIKGVVILIGRIVEWYWRYLGLSHTQQGLQKWRAGSIRFLRFFHIWIYFDNLTRVCKNIIPRRPIKIGSKISDRYKLSVKLKRAWVAGFKEHHEQSYKPSISNLH